MMLAHAILRTHTCLYPIQMEARLRRLFSD
jgi:hypothetical protein